MALDAKQRASGLIRQVQKVLGKGSQAAVARAAALRPQRADGLDKPAARLARRQRPRGARVHRRASRRAGTSSASAAWPPAASGALPEGSVVEILNDDMPFLVDSVLGELQARGLAVRLLLHPIFKTQRDKAGRLQEITGPGDQNWSDGHQESYIAIHLRSPAGDRRRAISRDASPPSWPRCAWWSPTGARCCSA